MVKALFRKQFAESTAFLRKNPKNGKYRSKAGTIALALLLIICYFSLGMAFFGMSTLLSDALLGTELEWLYFAVIGLSAIMLGVFGSVFTTYSTIYHARDNEQLLAMPIPPKKILLVRMVSVYFWAFIFTALAIVPAIIVYAMHGITSAASLAFVILLVPVVAVLSTVISCVLGWLVALISAHVKNKSIVTVILTLAFLAIYYYICFNTETLLTKLVENLIMTGGAVIKNAAYPVYILGVAATGSVPAMIGFTLGVGILFAAAYAILSRSFLKIVTMNRGEAKKVYKSEPVKARPAGKALLSRELKHFVGSPAYLLNAGLGAIIMPIAAVALLIKSGDVRDFITLISAEAPAIAEYMPLIALAVMCMIAGMGPITAPSISIEGKSLWILQTMPADTWEIFRAKCNLHLLVNGIPAAILTLAVAYTLSLEIYTAVVLLAAVASFIMLTGEAGLALNLKFPNLEWTSETVAVKQSVSALIIIFGTWGLVAALAAGYFFLLRDKVDAQSFLIVCLVAFAFGARFIQQWERRRGVEIFEKL